MQKQESINYAELLERGRKLQSEAVFETFRRGLMLLKILPARNRVTARANIGLGATLAK